MLGPVDIVLHRASHGTEDVHVLADLLRDAVLTHCRM